MPLEAFLNSCLKPNGRFVNLSTELSGDRPIWLIRSLTTAYTRCQNCSNCCNGKFFDAIPLLDDDKKAILKGTGMSESEFDPLCKLVPFTEDEKKLVKTSESSCLCIKQPCPFLKNRRCSIYSFRPKVCKYFPVNLMGNVFDINLTCPAGNKLYEKIILNGEDTEAKKAFEHE